ncbi:MAG: phosphoglucosamine mutase [Deltaproteobacteria bacterium]|nr:MAG: phosphoglucosamine mutase [Deltaproteobacteria bacterium]
MQRHERRLFGTDGVRGVANVHPMTTEVAMRLGQAIAYHVRRGRRRHRIFIGKDTRLSGYMLEQALAAGICSMGVDVLLSGPLPTPGIAFLTHSMRADAGTVISASHNPYQDNGIKFFARDGFKLPDEVELELERYVLGEDGSLDGARPTKGRVGKAFRIDDAVGRYVVHLKNRFPDRLTLDGVRIVVDCAHGAAYRVSPAVFEELGAQVVPMGVRPDGRNINRRCGALHPEAMAHRVVQTRAHIGVALDGDADRLVVADETGRVVHGDALLAALARHLVERKALRRRTLVTTVMSSVALDHAMAEVGGKVIRTQVGDRYVVERMRRSRLNFGGEQSGHLVFLDHATTGDGTLAALMVLAMMLEKERPLSELVAGFEPYPQALISVQVASKPPLDTVDPVQRVLREVERRLRGRGRVLVRYSGTEPKARVLVESDDPELARGSAERIAEVLERSLAA